MAGLCEGGNEPPGSLKASKICPSLSLEVDGCQFKVEGMCAEESFNFRALKSRIALYVLERISELPKEKDDHKKDSFYEELEQTFDQLPRYHMKILLGDFNAKVGREDIFKPTIENNIKMDLREAGYDDGD
ncbi:hypothetical protein ANN_23113 [Periplaneta americana]|uniref:Craniofacial development protein 2-like n=1 Tax=Periplaneta americana TaxID=6978 RepID=A0ABQ8SL75_PERAM|nr:hypothetical protein ANN_23113 [Periplaneta americana]